MICYYLHLNSSLLGEDYLAYELHGRCSNDVVVLSLDDSLLF